jgi:hypothetical protein
MTNHPHRSGHLGHAVLICFSLAAVERVAEPTQLTGGASVRAEPDDETHGERAVR